MYIERFVEAIEDNFRKYVRSKLLLIMCDSHTNLVVFLQFAMFVLR